MNSTQFHREWSIPSRIIDCLLHPFSVCVCFSTRPSWHCLTSSLGRLGKSPNSPSLKSSTSGLPSAQPSLKSRYVHLSFFLFLYSHFSVCQSVCLSVCLSVCISVSLSLCLLVCQFFCSLSVVICLACLSICLSVCYAVNLFVFLSLSISLSACLSVCQSVCLYWC